MGSEMFNIFVNGKLNYVISKNDLVSSIKNGNSININDNSFSFCGTVLSILAISSIYVVGIVGTVNTINNTQLWQIFLQQVKLKVKCIGLPH
jgi:hypothetical protein